MLEVSLKDGQELPWGGMAGCSIERTRRCIKTMSGPAPGAKVERGEKEGDAMERGATQARH